MEDLGRSTRDFEEYQRTRDPRLRDRIVEAHVGLAYSIARRFEGRGEDRDDLRQVALMALTNSIERFDPGRGHRFSSFAGPTINGSLKRHLRDRTWIVRPPRSVNERGLAAAAVWEQLTAALGRAPTVLEVATAGGWTARDVEEALFVGQTNRVKDVQPIYETDGAELGTTAEDVERVHNRLVVEDLSRTLEPRERTVVHLRYVAGMTQSHIADEIGVSQMHVSRLLKKSLKTMRTAAQNRSLSFTG